MAREPRTLSCIRSYGSTKAAWPMVRTRAGPSGQGAQVCGTPSPLPSDRIKHRSVYRTLSADRRPWDGPQRGPLSASRIPVSRTWKLAGLRGVNGRSDPCGTAFLKNRCSGRGERPKALLEERITSRSCGTYCKGTQSIPAIDVRDGQVCKRRRFRRTLKVVGGATSWNWRGAILSRDRPPAGRRDAKGALL